uniref:At2g38040/T8P21.5 n=1 Tax=Arabidopsis thaliana TaxID=3702 RepID=Q94EH3_ARATH|nr:At2g38040/T8P21.5 [Arabidopsis thaliana]
MMTMTKIVQNPGNRRWLTPASPEAQNKTLFDLEALSISPVKRLSSMI